MGLETPSRNEDIMTAGKVLLALMLLAASATFAGGYEDIYMKVGESFDQETGTFVEDAYETLLEAHDMITVSIEECADIEDCDTKPLLGLDILVTYNLACLEALNGETEAAFEWLTYAVETGYADPSWMQDDADLESLKTDDRFQALVDIATENAAGMEACGSSSGCGEIVEEHDCDSCEGGGCSS